MCTVINQLFISMLTGSMVKDTRFGSKVFITKITKVNVLSQFFSYKEKLVLFINFVC